jgi:CBS domain-containing protein
MLARNIMTSPVIVVAPHETVAHARKLMITHRISRVLVMNKGKISGILTKKDIAYRFRQGEPAWRRRPVDRIPVETFMSKNPVTVTVDTGVKDVIRIFFERDISSVAVVDGGSVSGIVTKSDVMKSVLLEKLDKLVSDVMEEAVVINRYHSVDHVIDMLSEYNKLVVANNDGTLAGVITETNLAFFEPFSRRPGSEEKEVKYLRKEHHGGSKVFRYVFMASVLAEDVMSHPVVTIGSGDRVSQAVAVMQEHNVNSLVVVEKDDIKGILKRDDILREVAK